VNALRPYQVEALERSREALAAGTNRQLMVLATALGKTVIFANLRRSHGFSKKIMVLVHRDELCTQAVDKLERWNPHLQVGVEMAARRSGPLDDFIVASVPTLGRKGSPRLARFRPEDFSAIVSDEAHHCPSNSWKYVLDHFGLMQPNPAAPLSLGVTATPNRSDGAGLNACFDQIVFDLGIFEGIESGYLCDLRGMRIRSRTDLDHVHTRAGDFAQDELADAVNTPERNALVVKEWFKHARHKQTICFTVNVQHALDLAEAFKAHGVAAEAVWGDDPERREKLAWHKAGMLSVLTNCALIQEGYDDPQIQCIVLAKPTKSQLMFTQMIGRGTRIPEGVDNLKTCAFDPGKRDCLILDVVDNTRRHSLVTLSSLMGLGEHLDLKGKAITEAKEQIERVAKDFPMANLADIKNLDDLQSIADSVDLFRVSFPPEAAKLTQFCWRKSAGGYQLSVQRDLVTITRDLCDTWQVRGWLHGNKIESAAQNLAGAFSLADRAVVASGAEIKVLTRDARWRRDPPSKGQIDLCRKLKIHIPAEATKGAVSVAIDLKLRRGFAG
jgi:superfamily II DNA or RNA helicase